MKNKLRIFGILSSGILLIVAGVLSVRSGIGADEYNTSPGLYGDLLWVGLLVGVLLLIIFSCNFFMKPVKLVFIGISLLMSVLFIVFEPDYSEAANSIVDSYRDVSILEVSWSEVEKLIDESHLSFLYVGRDNCPVCAEFKPRLNEFAEEAGITVYYYNTIEDREDTTGVFQERMEYLEVDSVPSILIVGNGKLEKLDSEDNLISEMKENILKVK